MNLTPPEGCRFTWLKNLNLGAFIFFKKIFIILKKMIKDEILTREIHHQDDAGGV